MVSNVPKTVMVFPLECLNFMPRHGTGYFNRSSLILLPSYSEGIPQGGNSFQCCYHRSGSECLWGKVQFSHNFLFQSLQQTGPTARVGNAAPFVWKKERKKGVDQHRQDLQLSSRSLNANLMDLCPKMKDISERLDHGYLRFYTSLLHFPVTVT